MATEVRTISTSTETLKRAMGAKSAGPVLDQEGNIVPEPEKIAVKEVKDTYWATSPLARLREVGRLDKPIPTAGQRGIEVSKEPELYIPPACFLYEEEKPWVLGKVDKKALDYAEPAEPITLSKQVTDLLDTLEMAVNVVATARIAMEYDEANENAVDESAEMYEKEKAAALASMANPEKAAARKSPKPKSRNASTSPGNKGAKRPITGKTSAPATTSASRTPAQGSPRQSTQPLKPKASSKSPGRGDAPPAKLATVSQRSSTAPKKVANAK